MHIQMESSRPCFDTAMASSRTVTASGLTNLVPIFFPRFLKLPRAVCQTGHSGRRQALFCSKTQGSGGRGQAAPEGGPADWAETPPKQADWGDLGAVVVVVDRRQATF
jgi:hypothetical protein